MNWSEAIIDISHIAHICEKYPPKIYKEQQNIQWKLWDVNTFRQGKSAHIVVQWFDISWRFALGTWGNWERESGQWFALSWCFFLSGFLNHQYKCWLVIIQPHIDRQNGNNANSNCQISHFLALCPYSLVCIFSPAMAKHPVATLCSPCIPISIVFVAHIHMTEMLMMKKSKSNPYIKWFEISYPM